MAHVGTGASQRTRIIVAVAALMFGATLVVYPYVSDYLHKLNHVEVIQAQASAVESQTDESLQRELEASFAYNERLLANRVAVTDPFDPNDRPVTQEEYERRCNIARDGVMGSIVIPAINVSVPIYHGTSEEALEKGAGHLEATSLPVGGSSTHCVVAGHNGLPSVRIFDDLHKLKVGDYFVVQVLGEDHAYRVTSIETVLPSKTDSLVVEDGRDLITLVTCTPYGMNTHRLLVHAERCEVPAAWYERDRDRANEVAVDAGEVLVPFSLAGVAVALGIGGAAAWRRYRSGAGGLGGGADGAGRSGSSGGARPGGPGVGSGARGAHFASSHVSHRKSGAGGCADATHRGGPIRTMPRIDARCDSGVRSSSHGDDRS